MSNKKANNDPISDALNMNPLTTIFDRMEAEAHDDSARKDFEYARSNLYTVIENGQEAIDKLSQIADSSQHPRAFEVLAGLMKTIVDANKDLLKLQRDIREIKHADTPHNEKAQAIHNNLFVGSTAELQKIIKELKTDE